MEKREADILFLLFSANALEIVHPIFIHVSLGVASSHECQLAPREAKK